MQTQIASQTVPIMAQRGGQFVPSFLVAAAGQTVSMPNEDEVAHNVYSLSTAKVFNLGYYAKGDVKTVTFDRSGMVEVACVIHPFMHAKVLVVPNSYYSTVVPDGRFHIRGVPVGKFTLNVWREGKPSFRQEAIVPTGVKPVSISVSWPNTPSKE